MNDKIATAFLTTLARAMVVGILYIVCVPIPEGPARTSTEAADAKRIEATLACIEHSGASKDRDCKLAGNKVAKCAEHPPGPEPLLQSTPAPPAPPATAPSARRAPKGPTADGLVI
jgi:hypothetical protein